MEEREYCEVTHKVCYSEKTANGIVNSAKRSHKKQKTKLIPQRSYYCQFCGSYHLTHYRKEKTAKVTFRKYGSRGYNDL